MLIRRLGGKNKLQRLGEQAVLTHINQVKWGVSVQADSSACRICVSAPVQGEELSVLPPAGRGARTRFKAALTSLCRHLSLLIAQKSRPVLHSGQTPTFDLRGKRLLAAGKKKMRKSWSWAVKSSLRHLLKDQLPNYLHELKVVSSKQGAETAPCSLGYHHRRPNSVLSTRCTSQQKQADL